MEKWIYQVCNLYNNEIHSTINITPREAMMRWESRITNYKGVTVEGEDDDLRRMRLEDASKTNSAPSYRDNLSIGDKVSVKNHHPTLFDPIFEEEMEITKVSQSSVELVDNYGREWRRPLEEVRKCNPWEGRLRD